MQSTGQATTCRSPSVVSQAIAAEPAGSVSIEYVRSFVAVVALQADHALQLAMQSVSEFAADKQPTVCWKPSACAQLSAPPFSACGTDRWYVRVLTLSSTQFSTQALQLPSQSTMQSSPCCALWESMQSAPPWLFGVVTVYAREIMPLIGSHADQELQLPTQSTGQGS
jgi:hypothetical protein